MMGVGCARVVLGESETFGIGQSRLLHTLYTPEKQGANSEHKP